MSYFAAGFLHPFTGPDHLLVMVAVGLLAGRMGRRAWLVPASFVVMMVAGALMSLAGVTLPATEIMIALSVVALGLAIVAPSSLGLGAAMTLVGFFAVFHGHAHGLEAQGAAFMPFVAGFSVATTLLHALGALAVVTLSARGVPRAQVLLVTGRAVMIAGVVLVVRMI